MTDLASKNIFDIMHTTRAMRRLKPDPVPDALIRQVMEAGTAAPNGGNNQTWRFMVLKDKAKKTAVAQWYRKAYNEVIGPRYANSAPPPGADAAKYARQHGAVEYLTDHFDEAPVWIVCCLADGGKGSRMSGASIYPAVQNMLLACRALGLGSTLTTRHMLFAKEADAALGLPEGIQSYAILPIGWPMGKFGPVGRGTLGEFVFGDEYGVSWDGAK